MNGARSFRVFEAASSAARLEAATKFLHQFPSDHPITVIAATRGAADDFARSVALDDEPLVATDA